MKLITKDALIGKVVADDFRTSEIFKEFNIDFCCKGKRSIEEACQQQAIAIDAVLHKLNGRMTETSENAPDFKQWDLDLLADYIEKTHHRYVRRSIPQITENLQKVLKVHGHRHPELFDIAELFLTSAEHLTSHMQKEELVLFPYVRRMIDATNENSTLQKPPFGQVIYPITMMTQEHEQEGQRFQEIARISDHYTPPTDACTTYRVLFSQLKAFEDDLHLHIHLENNILFPGAIEKEKASMYA